MCAKRVKLQKLRVTPQTLLAPRHIKIILNYIVFRSIEAMQQDMYSSQLSLGEIAHDVRFPSHLSADFDGISPISAQDVCGRRDSTLLRETKKLTRAVKQEDAYGIVCALKRGANPCLVINDVSALHLAAGIKSDQRCSMVSIRSGS